MAKSSAVAELKVDEPVFARVSLRGVPEGTAGKVIHVQGLTWTRYWVWFANGERVGTIDRSKLSTAPEWDRRHDMAVTGAGVSGPVAATAAEATAGGSTGGVPEYLLERSRNARIRLSAKG